MMTDDDRRELEERIRKSDQQLTRFPSWVRTGRGYEAWMLGIDVVEDARE